MSKSVAFANALLRLVFHGTAIPGIAQNAAAPLTSYFVALHTADPGEDGDQSTNEIAYTGYGRYELTRDDSRFIINNDSDVVTFLGNIDFPEKTGGAGGIATHISIGVDESGAGMILYKGPLPGPIDITDDQTIPRIKTGTTITEG